MKVVCIDKLSHQFIDEKTINSDGFSLIVDYLEVGKVYDVEYFPIREYTTISCEKSNLNWKGYVISGGQLGMINDVQVYFNSKRFKSIQDDREDKLNKILK